MALFCYLFTVGLNEMKPICGALRRKNKNGKAPLMQIIIFQAYD
jgi:hypothetical protein